MARHLTIHHGQNAAPNDYRTSEQKTRDSQREAITDAAKLQYNQIQQHIAANPQLKMQIEREFQFPSNGVTKDMSPADLTALTARMTAASQKYGIGQPQRPQAAPAPNRAMTNAPAIGVQAAPGTQPRPTAPVEETGYEDRAPAPVASAPQAPAVNPRAAEIRNQLVGEGRIQQNGAVIPQDRTPAPPQDSHGLEFLNRLSSEFAKQTKARVEGTASGAGYDASKQGDAFAKLAAERSVPAQATRSASELRPLGAGEVASARRDDGKPIAGAGIYDEGGKLIAASKPGAQTIAAPTEQHASPAPIAYAPGNSGPYSELDAAKAVAKQNDDSENQRTQRALSDATASNKAAADAAAAKAITTPGSIERPSSKLDGVPVERLPNATPGGPALPQASPETIKAMTPKISTANPSQQAGQLAGGDTSDPYSVASQAKNATNAIAPMPSTSAVKTESTGLDMLAATKPDDDDERKKRMAGMGAYSALAA